MSAETTDAAPAAAPAQTSLEKQTQALSSKEAREVARSQAPTCFCLTAKADRSLTSTLSKPDALRCMLDPKSVFMQRWDNFIMVLLLFVAFVTPFEVAFLPTKPDGLFAINRIVDAGFIIDMCFQFFLPYFDSSELVYVWNRDLIALNYCMGWFPIDVVSVLPYDFFGGDPFLHIELPEVDDEASGSLRTLRLVRLLRLIKLVRVAKSARIFTVLQTRYEMTFISISLIKLAVLCLVLLHWFSCLWGMMPGFVEGINWINGGGMELAGLGDLYAGAFEYSLQAMVNGYGDFTPHSSIERTLTLILMIIGSALYGYAIGEICDKTANLNPAQAEYQQNMDLLNKMMLEIKVRGGPSFSFSFSLLFSSTIFFYFLHFLRFAHCFFPAPSSTPPQTQLPKKDHMRFRQFFTFNKENFKNRFFIEELLDKMSPDLQGELAMYQHGAWIRRIPFFNAKSSEERRVFTSRVALCLEAVAFPPGETIYHEGDLANEMYIIQKGLAATKGLVVSEGSFFGEDFVLPGARRDSLAKSLTYTAMYMLKYDDGEEEEDDEGNVEGGKGILQILNKYGLVQTRKLIRKKAIQLALKAKFIQILSMVRLRPDYKPMSKEDCEHWKQLNSAKSFLKRHESKREFDMQAKEAEVLAESQKEVEKADLTLDFWLKGHVTGAEKPEDLLDGEDGERKDDLPTCIRKLNRRTERFELNLQRAKSMVESGFERIELHLEAQYKVFQDIIKKADRDEKRSQERKE